MAVAVDATGTKLSTTSASTSINYTGLTVGSGSNRGLILLMCFDSNTVTAPSATWDNGGTNQAMTLLKFQATTSGTAGAVAIFGLAAPTSGLKTLHASWTGSSQSSATAISFTGVNQTGGTTSFPNSAAATGNSSTNSVTITSAVGNMVVACHTEGGTGTYNAPNNTTIFMDNSLSLTDDSGNRAAGAASVVMSDVEVGTGPWASVGTDILAAGAAFVGQPRLKTHLRR